MPTAGRDATRQERAARTFRVLSDRSISWRRATWDRRSASPSRPSTWAGRRWRSRPWAPSSRRPRPHSRPASNSRSPREFLDHAAACQPIRRSAELGPISYWLSKAGPFDLTLRRYAVADAVASPTDPTYSVTTCFYTCTLDRWGAFHIPAGTLADPGSDGHLAILDPATGREWGMWQAQYNSTTNTWTAGSAQPSI
jgi:hypothetical protein